MSFTQDPVAADSSLPPYLTDGDPPSTDSAPSAGGDAALAEFVGQLGELFGASSLVQVEWIESVRLAITQHHTKGAAPEAQEILCGGKAAHLPLADGSAEVLFNLGSLVGLDEGLVARWLAEFYRVAGGSVWVTVAATPARNRAWWENRFFAAGFRKHPRLMEALPYETLEQEGETVILLFQKIPVSGLASYPLAALKAERDLHMDMTRETGRRSDAHIARYIMARRYLPETGLVLDAACGLGYGSAALACTHPKVRVVGLDNSEYAVKYGQACFQPTYPNLDFQTGDACDLSRFADATVDLVVSFETVEHLREPERFLAEIRRVLKPGGRFVCSVPNMWVDEHGKDPNPWHFHVFDFAKLSSLCSHFLTVEHAYLQTAGGGMKHNRAPRRLAQVDLPVTDLQHQAEWWLVAAIRTEDAPRARVEAGTVLALTSDPKHPLFTSWLPLASQRLEFVTNPSLAYEFPRDVSLVVGVDCYHEPWVTLLRKAVDAGIPTLILADGILEYRNTWENPRLAPGSLFQPVLGHKLACLGRSQARIVESWGNTTQCEAVGSPRFDRYAGLRRRQRPANAPFRVLVMTAITPYFTEAQHQLVRQSLLDLKAAFDRGFSVGNVRLEAAWRITKGLDREIGVDSVVTDLTGRQLAEVLQQVDAVITTPSTSMLEGMLLGLPVASLDYCNVPAYVQPSWRISAADHIVPVLTELVNPPAPKLLFQETTLHDALECATPTAPRLQRLAEKMIASGQEARRTGRPVDLTWKLDTEVSRGPRENGVKYDAAALYPGQAAFQENDLRALQVEVGHLRRHAAALEQQQRSGGSALSPLAQYTVAWKSKVEAALVLLRLQQRVAAQQVLLEAIKAVESCPQPSVTLEALVEICSHLASLDPGRTRFLLDLALKLAERLGNAAHRDRIRTLLANLGPASASASARA